MIIDYNASDEMLICAGLPERTLQLAKKPFMRKGGVDLDLPYALAVWNARDTRDIYALLVNNPDLHHVWFPRDDPVMGFVRG